MRQKKKEFLKFFRYSQLACHLLVFVPKSNLTQISPKLCGKVTPVLWTQRQLAGKKELSGWPFESHCDVLYIKWDISLCP